MNYTILSLFISIQSRCQKKPLKKPIYGLGYNAKHSDGSCPNQNKVDEDMDYMSLVTNRIRTFGLVDCNQGDLLLNSLSSKKKKGIKVALGMFINQYPFEFQREFELLKELVDKYRSVFAQNIDTIIVGSESIYRKENTVGQVASYIREVQSFIRTQNLTIKITTSDTKDMFYPSQLTKDSDVLFINAYPFWEGIPIEEAVDQIFNSIQIVKQRNPGKQIVISETGWPEGGVDHGLAKASKWNQLSYFNGFVCRAQKEELPFYWFSAFDEDWKTDEKNANWGIYKEGGRLKPGYQFPLNC